jgi:hypothetical protein
MVVACKFDLQLDGTEFMGGTVTGPLLRMLDVGCISFLFAAALTFRFPRVAAAIGLLACLLCLPVYLLFTAPGPFRWVFRGEWKTPLVTSLVWEWWSIGGILAIALAIVVCLRNVSASDRRSMATTPEPSRK